MKTTILGLLARIVLVVVLVGASIGAKGAASAQQGCTKQEAQTALDVLRFTADQVACMAAEADLGHTDPAAVAVVCGPFVDTELKAIEQFLLAQAKGKAIAAAKRAAAAP